MKDFHLTDAEVAILDKPYAPLDPDQSWHDGIRYYRSVNEQKKFIEEGLKLKLPGQLRDSE
jgi:hypothetical protein